MKKLFFSLGFSVSLLAAAPAFAFSVYQLQTDGNTARYMAPGASAGTGLKLSEDATQDNSVTIFQDGATSFSMSGGTSVDGRRPDSLNYNNNQPRNPDAPFTGYYLRDR
jgi:hypothetical protein